MAFITLEGLDGSGKSTQMRRLIANLRAHGKTVVATREPGGTALGQRIRELVLQGAGMAPETELALMSASRAETVASLIRPALERGEWVVCDRFHDSTEAYQSGGRGLDGTAIRTLHQALCGNLQPDLTLILDLDPAASLARARRLPAASRFEAENPTFYARVAASFRAIAAREPDRCRLIPATGSEDEVTECIEAAVAAWAAEHVG